MTLATSLRTSRYMQYLSTITATLVAASTAIYIAWPSPSTPLLQSDNSPLGKPITSEEVMWIGSSFILGGIPGSIVAGYVVEKFGRRGTLLFSAIPLFLPWVVILFTKSVTVLIFARFVAGLGSAFGMTALPVYIGEIAEKDIRGKLGVFIILMMNAGSFFALTVGPFVSYQILTIICGLFPLLFFILFFFMPESPYYLIKVGRKEAARQNLVRLSSSSANDKMIDDYLKEIEETVQYDMRNTSSLCDFLWDKEYRMSLGIMLGVKALQQCGGTAAIVMNLQPIIEESGSSLSPEKSSVIFGVTQIVSALVAAALIDKLGRKILLVVSALGCALFLTAEGVYFYLQDFISADMSNLGWLPTTSLTLYFLMNHIGVFSVPYVLLGELFATNIKGIAVSVFAVYSAILTFLVTILFFIIVDNSGFYTVFWIYAGISIFGAFFVLLVLPETKGKSFAEIQRILNKTQTNSGL